MDLIKLQTDLCKWLGYNFPNTSSDEQFKGIVEEIGELVEADIIYRADPLPAKKELVKDAVGDIIIYLTNYCTKNDISLAYCAADASGKVHGNGIYGIVISIGRLSHADLKHQQKIRAYTTERYLQEARSQIASIYIGLSNYCMTIDCSIDECIETAYRAILKRDWIKNPDGK